MDSPDFLCPVFLIVANEGDQPGILGYQNFFIGYYTRWSAYSV